MSEAQEPVTVEHARRLIEVYGKVRASERPWYYQWALTIDSLAATVERLTAENERLREALEDGRKAAADLAEAHRMFAAALNKEDDK